MSSQDLFGEQPRVYRPSVAKALGIAQAIVLEQLHYWLERSTKERDGQRYVYKTYKEWGEELGLTTKQVRKALNDLRTAGLVEAISNPDNHWDNTLWWTINEEKAGKLASALEGRSERPEGQTEVTQEADRDGAQGSAIPETTTKTTPKTTDKEPARAHTRARPDASLSQIRGQELAEIKAVSHQWEEARIAAGRKRAHFKDAESVEWLYGTERLLAECREWGIATDEDTLGKLFDYLLAEESPIPRRTPRELEEALHHIGHSGAMHDLHAAVGTSKDSGRPHSVVSGSEEVANLRRLHLAGEIDTAQFIEQARAVAS